MAVATHQYARRSPSAMPTAPAVARTARGHWLTAVQRTAGNRAVGELLAARASSSRAMPVQRECACGGSCSSCSARSNGEREDRVEDATQAPSAGGLAVQRLGDPAKPLDLTGTPFAAINGNLKAAFERAYTAGQAGDKGALWGKAAYFPTLADALRAIPVTALSAAAQVAALLDSAAPGVWPTIGVIHSMWWTSSQGFDFTTAGAPVPPAEKAGFCIDNPATAYYYHGTTNCVRQVCGGAPGLHVCAKGANGEVHVDTHQPTWFKNRWDGGCAWDPRALLGHAGDILGSPPPPGPFQRADGLDGRVEALRRKMADLRKLAERHPSAAVDSDLAACDARITALAAQAAQTRPLAESAAQKGSFLADGSVEGEHDAALLVALAAFDKLHDEAKAAARLIEPKVSDHRLSDDGS